MPLTSITIENFKGISAPVTIPIRPLTLFFGKNSAGKSTILQALHYLREVLENRRPDPDRTQLGGDAIDLGGFQSLVHRNELDRRIRIRVTFSLDDDGIPNNGITSPGGATEKSRSLSIDLNEVVKLESAWIEVVTAWENSAVVAKYSADELEVQFREENGAYISEYSVGLNDDELVRMRQPYGAPPELLSVNVAHGIVRELDRQYDQTQGINRESDHNADELPPKLSEQMWPHREYSFEVPKVLSESVPLNKQGSIIPNPYTPFLVDNDFTDESIYQDPEVQFPFWSLVGQALTGPLSLLLRELRGIRYLGPIREVPPRNYRAPRTPDESRWANGLGAWDALARDPDLAEQASQSLQDTLKLGYSIQREERISIDAEGEVMAALRLLVAQYDERDAAFLRAMVLGPLEQLPRQSVVQLHDEVNGIDVDPSDIGVGVSQVLPVVVGALDSGSPGNPCRIFAVEQPELHVHPAVQVALGDVFIDAVRGTGRIMLVETHSEYLILRLLRRIRESAEDSQGALTPTLSPDMLSIIYVKPKEGGVEITPLPVTEDGDFARQWPDGFFEERAEELF